MVVAAVFLSAADPGRRGHAMAGAAEAIKRVACPLRALLTTPACSSSPGPSERKPARPYPTRHTLADQLLSRHNASRSLTRVASLPPPRGSSSTTRKRGLAPAPPPPPLGLSTRGARRRPPPPLHNTKSDARPHSRAAPRPPPRRGPATQPPTHPPPPSPHTTYRGPSAPTPVRSIPTALTRTRADSLL